VAEIGALEHVFGWARQRYRGEDDFIALGDFNAGCDYASPDALDALAISRPGHKWIVPHDADTNLAASRCAYDRIVITEAAVADWTGRWGVDRAFEEKKVSDHWPVWASFRTSGAR
jgi:endonuclease/exonuclease/phosphatase family metal-dependent hydrolase